MSLAYCKNCLKRIEDCDCENEEIIYGDTRFMIAQIVKFLKDNGFEEAAEKVDEKYL